MDVYILVFLLNGFEAGTTQRGLIFCNGTTAWCATVDKVGR